MEIRAGNAQWQGTRKEQQDAFGFLGFDNPDLRAHGGLLVVLADGMGGMHSGVQASRLAVERMMAAYAEKRPEEPIPQALSRAFEAANLAVHQLACEREGEGEVGTTLVAAAVLDAELHWIGAGDSRLYLYRTADDSLTQCNDDHTYANELRRKVAAGALRAEDAAADPDRQSLTSFLGLAQIPEIDRNLYPVHLAPGDRLLLCSDGVHALLCEADIRPLLRQEARSGADALIRAVQDLALPDQDNATAAVLGLEADAQSHAEPSPAKAQPTRRPIIRALVLGLSALALVLLGVAIGLDPHFAEQWAAPSESAPGPAPATANGSEPPAAETVQALAEKASASDDGEPIGPAPGGVAPAAGSGVQPPKGETILPTAPADSSAPAEGAGPAEPDATAEPDGPATPVKSGGSSTPAAPDPAAR